MKDDDNDDDGIFWVDNGVQWFGMDMCTRCVSVFMWEDETLQELLSLIISFSSRFIIEKKDKLLLSFITIKDNHYYL